MADDPKVAAPPARARYGWPALSLIGVMLGLSALFAWATFWPMALCSDPSCARQRFTLALEVDAFERIEPIAFEFDTHDGPVSLHSILASGGVELITAKDDLNVPYQAASGPLDRADLYQFVSVWRNRPAPPHADARLYALFAPGLISDRGEQLFGIMFDLADREAFAVAPATTQRFFEMHESESIPALQLRTFVHELLHALNRDHADAATMADGRLTLEAPTRCLAVGRPREWRLVEPPLMALSPATIRFFQSAASRDVLPGRSNSPYIHRRSAAAECEQARANVVVPEKETQWRVALRELKTMFAIRGASAAEPVVESTDETPTPEPDFDVHLQVQQAAYPLGYPIAVRIRVTNRSDDPMPIRNRLNPGYGMVRFEYRETNSDEWQTLQPIVWFEPTSDADAMLAPGEMTEETIPVYFGEDGWTFTKPGAYEARVRLQVRESQRDAESETVAVRIAEPETESDRAALQPLLNEDGELDRNLGRLLSFGGRIGNAADITPLESIAALYADTALGSAFRLTLLSQRLRPPIDPRTGERPLPDFSDARELIEDICTDSGVAAMTAELLDQRADTLPARFRGNIVDRAAAWDGTSASGKRVTTYADPALQRFGPSIHFCFNETHLRRDLAGDVRSLARMLASKQPKRIVLVGHGDREGSCRINDAIALRRTHAIRSALIAAGVDRRTIEMASLGERRPLDFSTSEMANALNRRVEILVEGAELDDAEELEPLLPQCPPR